MAVTGYPPNVLGMVTSPVRDRCYRCFVIGYNIRVTRGFYVDCTACGQASVFCCGSNYCAPGANRSHMPVLLTVATGVLLDAQ
jgi:hypothetical protein